MKTINYKILIETKQSEEEFQAEILDYDLEYTFYDHKEVQGFNQVMIEGENKSELEHFIIDEAYDYDLVNEIQEEEIDWKQRSKDLELALNSLLKTCKERSKEIRDLKKQLKEAQTQIIETEDYRIGLNFDLNIHWWEYSDGTEGGELVISRNKTLKDYDGTYQISDQILEALRSNGINTALID